MSLARLVVTAVTIEGRTKAEVSRDYGVSPRWVYELCRRFDAEGETGLEPRSRRPHRSPRRTIVAPSIVIAVPGAPGRNRTCDTRFRKPLLYPLSYEAVVATA